MLRYRQLGRGELDREASKELFEAAGASAGRISTPEEVARLIVFLAPPNTNGSDYIIDGGIFKTVYSRPSNNHQVSTRRS